MAHTNDKVCLTVGAVLVRNNKVLLFNHPRYNLWLPVGGHIEAGEDLLETLYREIKEESGYEAFEVEVFGSKPVIQPDDAEGAFLISPAFMDRHPAEDREHVGFAYLAKVTTDRDPTKSDEHTDMRWFTKEELEELGGMLRNKIKFYCHEALRVFGED